MADETLKPVATPEEDAKYQKDCAAADSLMERAVFYMLDAQQLPSSAVFNALIVHTLSVARTMMVVVKPEYTTLIRDNILDAIDSLRAKIVTAAGGADIDRESYLAHRRGMRVPDRPQ